VKISRIRTGKRRLWLKFGYALRGIFAALRIENTFKFHLAAAAAAIAISAWLGLNAAEWCLILTAVGLVLVAEMFNTAMELLVRMYTRERHELAQPLLDISAGAVLLTSLLAATVGVLVWGARLIERWHALRDGCS